jgi:Tol biopolymer transport system component
VDPVSTGPQIWQIGYPMGDVRRVTNDLNNYLGASLSADGRTMVTVQAENVANLWILPEGDLARGRQVTSGRGRSDGQTGLSWTLDGRLVFGSVASGRPEIWSMKADGSDARQLTNDEAPSIAPSASPDGRYIVFQRYRADGMQIWRMSADGSDARALTSTGAEFGPVVGADSRTVFFNSPASGQPITFKVSIDGGEAVKVSDGYFRPVDVSPDGHSLLGIGWHDGERRSTLGILPIAGGPVRLLSGGVPTNARWAPDGRALTHLAVRDNGIAVVNTPIGGGPSRELFALGDNLYALGWSRDGRQLAVSRGTGSSDVVLITAK